MAKNTYLGANVVTTDSFAGWIDKTNQVRDDMGRIVVTVTTATGAEPNTVNAGLTTGNLAIQGVVTANTIAVSSALRGGTVTVPSNLTITSNALFTTTGNVEFTAANNINIDANNFIVSSNVNFDGGATKIIRIDTANTTVNTGTFYVNSNAIFSSNVTITGSNTTIGDAGTDVLNNLATSVHSANALFSGALVNITSTNTTIGDAGTDVLNVNAIADFNANVNIDGVLTVTANATFSGANININGNTTIGDAATDILNVNATLGSDLIPLNNTIDLGTSANTYGNVFSTYVYSANNIQTSNEFILNGTGVRTIRTIDTGAVATPGSFKFIVANNTTSNTVLIANTSGLFGSANIAYDLGSATTSWKSLFVRDATVANALAVTGAITASNTLAVTGGITASNTLVVTGSITASNTLAVTGDTSLSANLSLVDNKYINVGTGQDLLLYHDATNSFIKNNTGSLKIDAAQLDIVTSNSTATETMATYTRDGAVSLYYDNAKKFETTAAGVTVSGITITGDLTVQGVTNLATNASFTVSTSTSNTSTVYSTFTSQGNTTLGTTGLNRLDVNANTLFSANVTINGTTTVGALVANSKVISVGGNITTANSLTTTGNFALTLAQTGATNITLPTTGTLATLTGTETLTNKTLTAPVLGVASATSLNKVTITAPAIGSTLTIADGKTATVSNTLTFTGTDASSVAFGTGGTVLYTTNKLSAHASTLSSELASVISDETGSGSLVFGTAPTLSDVTLNGNTAIGGNMVVTGNLTINGTTTTVNSTTITVDDINIELGSIATPTDTTANGGGITLKGTTDKTINWVSTTGAWTSSESFNLLTGKSYQINGTSVLNATTLGAGVTGSSLTSVGTLTVGTWNASTIDVNRGGTGVTTLTGYVKGAGTTALTASATIPNTDITGLGTMSTQAASAVAITGGSITGITDITVADGGTGVSTLTGYVKGNGTAAMTASATIPSSDITGLSGMALQAASAVAITGGTITGISANVGIGTTTPTNSLDIVNTSGLGSASIGISSNSPAAILVKRSTSDAGGAEYYFQKQRGTIAAPTAVSSGDQIGVTSYSAYDGATSWNTSKIEGFVETFTAANNISGYLKFSTKPDGAPSLPLERLRITGNGNIGIGNTAPAHTLSVNGTAYFGGNTTFNSAITETVYAITGTTPALNPANGTIQTWTLTASSTPTDSLAAGQSITLMIDDGTAYTITWPSVTWKTNTGTAPTLNTTGYTAIVLWKVGSVLYGARVGDA